MINKIRGAVKERKLLIHCITNPISINQCANTILAAGARPIMAEHPREVEEITETAGALLLNLGNITDARIQSILLSAGVASRKGIPFVLDAVGTACSRLRLDFVQMILSRTVPTLIKGNYSEIQALYQTDYRSSGVDADASLSLDSVVTASAALAGKYRTVVLASGAVDIVTDGEKVILIRNGSPQMSCVTGTGCMLGALCATYLSVCPAMEAAAAACVVFGICGEKAETEKGSGTFMVNLMDQLSVLRDEEIEKLKKVEETRIETV